MRVWPLPEPRHAAEVVAVAAAPAWPPLASELRAEELVAAARA
jgi:hypothetical protein